MICPQKVGRTNKKFYSISHEQLYAYTMFIYKKVMSIIKEFLGDIGLSKGIACKIEPLLLLALTVIVALFIAEIVYRLLRMILIHILQRNNYKTIDKIVKTNTLRRAIHIIPPLIINSSLPLLITQHSRFLHYLTIIVWIYFVIMLTRAVSSLISSVGDIMFSNKRYHNRPIKGFIQIARIIVYIISFILIISIITNKSPLYLIGGLGAFAAVLMLVAKDSIMGFVGGFLLLENDMIRIGDWIEVPGSIINGTVYDISLTIVKVRNFDNTYATIPPYTLINSSFINWRGMSESGGRRIARGYQIKTDNIKPCNKEFIERVKINESPISSFLTRIEEKKGTEYIAETNAELFRRYAEEYLLQHPRIRKDMLIMVRTLEPTSNGLPIQFYCFTDTTEWSEYESIQSQIMEHFAYVMPFFELYPYQNTGARDTIIGGMLEASYPMEKINGLPYKLLKKDERVK